jgi:hypothetical protein
MSGDIVATFTGRGDADNPRKKSIPEYWCLSGDAASELTLFQPLMAWAIHENARARRRSRSRAAGSIRAFAPCSWSSATRGCCGAASIAGRTCGR